MTLEQLEQKVNELAQQVAVLQRARVDAGSGALAQEDTFGMFAADAGFDEMVRLGRNYRDQVNSEDL